MRILTAALSVLFALGLLGTVDPATGQARRIVSINACTDQLAFKLAPAQRIAALSIYAADATLSLYAGEVQASGLPLISGSVEEVLKLKPDLVLAGTWTRRITRDRLKREGIRIEEFAAPNSIEEVKAGIIRMAELLGEEERAKTMLREIDAAVQDAAQIAGGEITALQFQRRGYTSGEDSLLGDVLRKAGIRNAARMLGIASVGQAALETVLKARADLLVLLDANPQASDQGTALLYHPALLAAYPPQRRVVLANNLTVCGGPAVAAALRTLMAALQALPDRK